MTTNTSFSEIYNSFLSKITEDMYMELMPEETEALLSELLLSAIFHFEFPKVDIFDYNLETEAFNVGLTHEEINIIAVYMVAEWMGQQLASIENTRMKYSGEDFKFTSQAAHMAAIQKARTQYLDEGKKLQRLYKRRERNEQGQIVSTMSKIMEVS